MSVCFRWQRVSIKRVGYGNSYPLIAYVKSNSNFINALKAEINLPVYCEDERFTTIMAHSVSLI